MKKIKKLLILLLFIPFIIRAEQSTNSCLVVSGNGTTIGDEIACGNEHFYVIDANETNVKALAKYNLNVGDKIDVFEVNEDTLYVGAFSDHIEDSQETFNQATNRCNTLAAEKGYNAYLTYPFATLDRKENYNYYFKLTSCRVYEHMNEDHVKQDPRAIGTKLDGNGKSILPLYGITYMNPQWGPKKADNTLYENIYDENGNIQLDKSYFKTYLDDYKSELVSQGYVINDISFIGLNGSIKLLKDISGQDITVQLQYDNWLDEEKSYISYTGKMDIKQYVPSRFDWIHSISYWLGSGFNVTYEQSLAGTEGSEYNDYFISNEGLLCAIGRGECSYFSYPIGNGVRPVITLSVNNIIDPFKITTETEGKGTVEVVNSAYADDQITFRAIPEKNYKIKYVIVTDKMGNSVTFKEDQLIQNSDGTISINSFTMPSSDVLIKVGFEIINPKTGVSRPVAAMLFGLLISGIAYYSLLKKEKNESL